MGLIHKMMFNVHQSKLDFDETVTKLTESAKEHGWGIPMVHDLQKSYQESGYKDMTKVTTLYFCNPSGGYRILKEDKNKPMSVMMPMGVSVYEAQDGQVYIAGMNLERMSLMFGGTAKEVLREGAVTYAQTLEGIVTPKKEWGIKINWKRWLFGCLSVFGVLLVLLGILMTIMAKLFSVIMPKMMTTMMPKMMAIMEETGLQEQCADMLLEHIELRKLV